MNRKIIKALYKKEIMDILRDKKTLLMMIVVPLVLYPLIFICSMYVASSVLTENTSISYRVGLVGDLYSDEEFMDFLSVNGKTYDYHFIFIGKSEETLAETGTNNFETELKEEKVDAYISDYWIDDMHYFEIHYSSSMTNSSAAASMISDMIKLYQEKVREDKVTDLGADPDYVLHSVIMTAVDSATSEETVGSLFGYVIPFLLIASVLMGAMYPAIDTTAGEKERGTLETLLTLPVKNIELIFSKFLATTTIATGAALLNVVSMGIIGGYFYGTIKVSSDAIDGFSISTYIPAILITLLAACVFAMFSSAVCLLVCIFAKSFKEAQNYSTPIMVVFMMAGMAGMLPALTLNQNTALIPVINTALLIADLFSFNFNSGLIITVLCSNIAYSLIAVIIMARLFSSEGILFDEGIEGIHIIERRSDMREKQIPGIGDVILLFSILLIAIMMCGSLLVLKFGLYGLIGEQLIIAGATLLYCAYIKTDWKKVFSLRKPKGLSFVAGTITWLGTYLIMVVLSGILAFLFKESAASADSQIIDLFEDHSFLILVIATAAFPAICEELAFRGFLFGTLKNRYQFITAILWPG